MDALLAQCRWPELQSPYGQALRDAATFILTNFDVSGIIASGSIIRGNPHRNSDFDIYAIHAKQERQRIQKFFQGVPTEIFLNPPSMIYRYFADETGEGRPSTAHILAMGFVILDRDPSIEVMRQQAAEILAQGAKPTEIQLKFLRYGAADRFENALDVADSDASTANMILNGAVYDMLHYHFLKQNRFIPRDKDLLKALDEQNPNLGQLSREFYRTANLTQRLQVAQQIADLTIETQGFFEWESQREQV